MKNLILIFGLLGMLVVGVAIGYELHRNNILLFDKKINKPLEPLPTVTVYTQCRVCEILKENPDMIPYHQSHWNKCCKP